MTEDILFKLGWKSTWDSNNWVLDNLLLWIPVDRKETIITSVNNYKNTLFKGIIETEEEITNVTKLLTKRA